MGGSLRGAFSRGKGTILLFYGMRGVGSFLTGGTMVPRYSGVVLLLNLSGSAIRYIHRRGNVLVMVMLWGLGGLKRRVQHLGTDTCVHKQCDMLGAAHSSCACPLQRKLWLATARGVTVCCMMCPGVVLGCVIVGWCMT